MNATTASHTSITPGVLPVDADYSEVVTDARVIRTGGAHGKWVAEYRPGAALAALDQIDLEQRPNGNAPNALPWFLPLEQAVGLGTCMWMTYGDSAAPQPYHQDLWAETTTVDWCSAIAVRRGWLREGEYTGFLTVFPDLGVAFDLQDGDLIVFDHMQWHGNTMFDGDLDRQVIVMAFAERPK